MPRRFLSKSISMPLCVNMIAVKKSQGGSNVKVVLVSAFGPGGTETQSTAVVVLDKRRQCGPSTGCKVRYVRRPK